MSEAPPRPGAAPPFPPTSRDRPRKTAVVASTPSDSHTWGLVVLQCVLEEAGFFVRNLGACCPVDVLLDECRAAPPTLVAISTVNGHGRVEGAELISAFRRVPGLSDVPVVIGGMLTTGGTGRREVVAELTGLGFTGVFVGDAALREFRDHLAWADAHAR
ncbi:cobalamin-dependent protein [Actinomadura miaoliensis]|uniref:Cobalamin B12-binding domain-containing protein n=1 Tax=Actinomadura miaoliensis TaxID=430685 RepID=A0ABP7V0Q2_9ACTN